jgi:hypothetical protein
MNSELGMLLPFAFVIFLVWSGSRVLLARIHARGGVPADVEKQLIELRARIEELERTADLTAAELQRVAEAERFTTQLLSERSQPRDSWAASAIRDEA